MNDGIFKSKTCPYCGVPITPNAAIQPGHCGAADCMTRHVVLGHKAVQAARVEVATRNVKVASEANETAELPGLAGVASLENMVLVTVPHQNKPLVPVPAERMEVFQENLRSSIEQAFAADDEEIASIQIERNSQAEQPILAAGCATCQGYCCGLGAANNAFLNAEVIKGHRQRLAAPCRAKCGQASATHSIATRLNMRPSRRMNSRTARWRWWVWMKGVIRRILRCSVMRLAGSGLSGLHRIYLATLVRMRLSSVRIEPLVDLSAFR